MDYYLFNRYANNATQYFSASIIYSCAMNSINVSRAHYTLAISKLV